MQQAGTDRRVVARFVVDVLVTPEQVGLLELLLAQALCADPDDHAGPCRVAWRISHATEQPSGGSPALPDDVVRSVRDAIGALEVLPADAATRALREDLR